MCCNPVKSKFFAAIFVVFVFSAVILSGGCDGGSSDTNQEVSGELLAEAGYFGKYQPDDNEICFKLAEGTQLDWNEHKEQLEGQIGMELLEVAQLEKPAEQDSGGVERQEDQNAENRLETANLQSNAVPLLLGQVNAANDAAGQEIPADSSKLQVLNFGLGGSQDVSLSAIPADFMKNNPQLKESVEKLIIPGETEEIGANAFADMPKLSRVVIFGTPSVAENAFANCPNLEFVSIGCGDYLDMYREVKDELGHTRPSMHGFMREHKASAYSIGDRAFANCPKLQLVDFGFTAPPKFGNAVFEGTPLRLISVPYPAWYKNTFKKVLPSAYSKYVGSKTWMADLPDDQLITQLSLPATHDSATFGLTNIIEMYGRTQGLNFGEQFDSGVRCFDMRLGYWGHSELYLGHAFSAGITFSAAVDTIKNKLKSNPKEFVIIEFAWDGTPSTSNYTDMQNAVLKHNNDKNAVIFKPDLRLKDVRGKFLFMNCDVNDTKGVTLDSSICCRCG
ncbi:MAG: leucine-rich repeat protein [Synergistaceae bacterium]|nr:leucine-rich repeat protein [Synergistaceae bacterium]